MPDGDGGQDDTNDPADPTSADVGDDGDDDGTGGDGRLTSARKAERAARKEAAALRAAVTERDARLRRIEQQNMSELDRAKAEAEALKAQLDELRGERDRVVTERRTERFHASLRAAAAEAGALYPEDVARQFSPDDVEVDDETGEPLNPRQAIAKFRRNRPGYFASNGGVGTANAGAGRDTPVAPETTKSRGEDVLRRALGGRRR